MVKSVLMNKNIIQHIAKIFIGSRTVTIACSVTMCSIQISDDERLGDLVQICSDIPCDADIIIVGFPFDEVSLLIFSH